MYLEFENLTGIKVNVKKDKDDKLIALLQAEDSLSKADLLFTADAGRLCYAKKLNLLQPITSDSLSSNIPTYLRDSEGYWFGITKRARVIVHSKNVSVDSLPSNYLNLSDSTWYGKVVSRSSSNIYNQSLMASIINNCGDSVSREFIQGYVRNLASVPVGNDRDQVKKIASGQGQMALVNTYYIGKMINGNDVMQQKAVKQVRVYFPNQNSTGTHVNVSGGGVTKFAKNKSNAIKLLEFLISKSAQEKFVRANFEYPIRKNVELHPTLKEWGEFREDTMSLSKLGDLNGEALKIMLKNGWK